MNNLVEFSSGIDSLGALLIAMEKYPMAINTLMHLQIRTIPICDNTNFHYKWLAQLSNTLKIVDYLKKNYFAYLTELASPIIQIPFIFGVSSLDITYYRFFSGLLSSNNINECTYIIKGVSKTDCEKSNMVLPEFGPSNVESNAQEDDIILSAVNAVKKNTTTVVWRPGVHHTKRELYDLIPKELQDYIWYCDFPSRKNNIMYPCGTCPKCSEAAEFDIVGNPCNITNVLNVETNYKEYLSYAGT